MPENREISENREARENVPWAGKRLVPGERIGDITILRDTGERRYHCVVWHCRCELCGGEMDLIQRDFSRRHMTDCGCKTPVRHLRERIKPGDKFGLLTVLSDSGGRKHSEIIWNCQCKCGNEILVNTAALHDGRVSDCGCVSSRETSLLGKQFGHLTVIGDEGTRTGDHVWRCRCFCGRECFATSSHLTHGRVKSCGCIRHSVWEENLKLVEGTSVTKLEARRANSDRLNAANTSGYNGVYPQSSHGKRTGRWVAQIDFKHKKYYLGAFDRPEDAAEARKQAEERLYDGFIDWYYKEYLPAQKAAKTKAAETVSRRETDHGEQRPAETAAAL